MKNTLLLLLLFVLLLLTTKAVRAALTYGYKTRNCDNPAPQYGGKACEGPATQDCVIEDDDESTTVVVTDDPAPACWASQTNCVCGVSCQNCCSPDPCNAFAQILGVCR